MRRGTVGCYRQECDEEQGLFGAVIATVCQGRLGALIDAHATERPMPHPLRGSRESIAKGENGEEDSRNELSTNDYQQVAGMVATDYCRLVGY